MNLKEIRVSRKLKVQEVSDYLCCLPSVYSRYENGKREPSIDILLKLSKLYGVSVDYLIGNDEVVDTSITEKEAAMISVMRQADERARQDAIALKYILNSLRNDLKPIEILLFCCYDISYNLSETRKTGVAPHTPL